MKREDIEKALKKKATYGQFHSEGIIRGGWFIWLMDAVEITEELLKREKVKR